MEQQLQALVPFSNLLQMLDMHEDDPHPLTTAVQSLLPSSWSTEVADQLLAFCRGGQLMYSPSFLRLANYLMLAGFHERLEADARRHGDHGRLQQVVEAGIGYYDTWIARFPVDATGLSDDEVAARGLYYLGTSLPASCWAKHGHVDA